MAAGITAVLRVSLKSSHLQFPRSSLVIYWSVENNGYLIYLWSVSKGKNKISLTTSFMVCFKPPRPSFPLNVSILLKIDSFLFIQFFFIYSMYLSFICCLWVVSRSWLSPPASDAVDVVDRLTGLSVYLCQRTVSSHTFLHHVRWPIAASFPVKWKRLEPTIAHLLESWVIA